MIFMWVAWRRFVLDNELFVFRKLAEMVHFIRTDGGWKRPGVLGHNEGIEAG